MVGRMSCCSSANLIWKKLLNEYEKQPIDPAIEEELEAYITKLKEQILT